MSLIPSEQSLLLQIARASITHAVAGERLPSLGNVPESFSRKSGVFVTLHEFGELRGCIGYIEPIMPLAQAVQIAAMKAALEDPRFDPVKEDEVPLLKIEISVLSPVEPCTDPRHIVIGTHGLILELGRRRGLLLPQVATEYGWDREQFLEHTALKAGLARDSWKRDDVLISTFTVQKFAEADSVEMSK